MCLASRVPPSGLVSCGLHAVVGVAQPTAVSWVVRVEVAEHELTSAERVVVGDRAQRRTSVDDADGVSGEDAGPEDGVCLAGVAACCC